jgi:hypothetical protein
MHCAAILLHRHRPHVRELFHDSELQTLAIFPNTYTMPRALDSEVSFYRALLIPARLRGRTPQQKGQDLPRVPWLRDVQNAMRGRHHGRLLSMSQKAKALFPRQHDPAGGCRSAHPAGRPVAAAGS